MPRQQYSARRSAAETRQLMLNAAVKDVEQHGLPLDFGSISLEHLIRASGAPRSTVFRIWPDRTAFVADFITSLFTTESGMDGTGFDEQTFVVMHEVISRNAHRMDTQQGRDEVLRELIRESLARNIAATISSQPWHVYRAIFTAINSAPDAPETKQIREALHAMDERFLSRMEEIYAELTSVFHRRFRAGLSVRDFAILAAAIVEGLADRQALNADEINRPRAISHDSLPPENWHIGALAIYGIVLEFTEPTD